MAPLEDLERDYPIIDSNFRMFCASHGIFTDTDFLMHDLSALEAFARQDYAPQKLEHDVKGNVATTMIYTSIIQWANLKIDNGFWTSIDILLQGGLRAGHVTELVGPSCSGKTQVCLKAASHVARNSLGKVVYFDTGNSFSPKRVAQFLSFSPDPSTTQLNKTVERDMSSIVCHSVFDIFTLLDMLRQLRNNLRSQISFQMRMLIIDSLSSLIAPVLGGGGVHGHALMATAGLLLKEIAHESNLCVVVTNHMVAGEAGMLKPALGESWKSIPHVRLLLSGKYSANGTRIKILKHPYLASGKSTDFVVI
ncbi:DNA repair protein RAD51 homolog 4-like isoform X3 [Salvia splendens]|uniref:DNA repair protein RAD51 homolog 4-like isoform X3 n=1 Tax=Salvia splendens TaxID=180675 RepID=UPI001C2606B4|nr:DNA repair protein RAD51 homolog 4-like isoform X3 [Salvia splendens]